jgi:hypothetical protein
VSSIASIAHPSSLAIRRPAENSPSLPVGVEVDWTSTLRARSVVLDAGEVIAAVDAKAVVRAADAGTE